jgi:hypothetical protein
MKRYFFDIVSGHRSEYDYRGHDCPTANAAHQLAELIALDLGIEPDGKWCGWNIKVRCAQGQQFFSIPVREHCLAAA